jgi:hypothetical protein
MGNIFWRRNFKIECDTEIRLGVVDIWVVGKLSEVRCYPDLKLSRALLRNFQVKPLDRARQWHLCSLQFFNVDSNLFTNYLSIFTITGSAATCPDTMAQVHAQTINNTS